MKMAWIRVSRLVLAGITSPAMPTMAEDTVPCSRSLPKSSGQVGPDAGPRLHLQQPCLVEVEPQRDHAEHDGDDAAELRPLRTARALGDRDRFLFLGLGLGRWGFGVHHSRWYFCASRMRLRREILRSSAARVLLPRWRRSASSIMVRSSAASALGRPPSPSASCSEA